MNAVNHVLYHLANSPVAQIIVLNGLLWPGLAAYYLIGSARRRRRENCPPDALETRLRDVMSQDPDDAREPDPEMFLAALRMAQRGMP